MKAVFAPVFALTLVASVIASECPSIPVTADSVQCALDSGFSLSNVTEALVNDATLVAAFCNSDACQSFLVDSTLYECTIHDLRLFADIFYPLSSACFDLVMDETRSDSGSTAAAGSIEVTTSSSASATSSGSGSTAAGTTSSVTSSRIVTAFSGFVATVTAVLLL